MVLYGRVLIEQVTAVEPHPQNDDVVMLDVVHIGGKTNVANRPALGQPRYKIGDYAAVLTEDLILPEFLLRHLDLWNEQKQKGMLGGAKGNRTKPRVIRGVPSEVALCAVTWTCEPQTDPSLQSGTLRIVDHFMSLRKLVTNEDTDNISPIGRDVGELLGVTVYDPPR